MLIQQKRPTAVSVFAAETVRRNAQPRLFHLAFDRKQKMHKAGKVTQAELYETEKCKLETLSSVMAFLLCVQQKHDSSIF